MKGIQRSALPGVILLAGLALGGCGGVTDVGFSPQGFEPIPPLAELDWGAVDPGEAWDYWEFRRTGPNGDAESATLLGSGGTMARSELSPAVREAMDAAAPPSGFAVGCLPGHCFSYALAVDGEAVTVIVSRTELEAFLSPITTQAEATVLATARSYVWWDEGSHTGVTQMGPPWDLVLFELVRDCDPVEVHRVRYRVTSSGEVTERAREVWERSPGLCI